MSSAVQSVDDWKTSEIRSNDACLFFRFMPEYQMDHSSNLELRNGYLVRSINFRNCSRVRIRSFNFGTILRRRQSSSLNLSRHGQSGSRSAELYRMLHHIGFVNCSRQGHWNQWRGLCLMIQNQSPSVKSCVSISSLKYLSLASNPLLTAG